MNWMRESPASRNLESFLIARVLASPGETFDEEVAVSEKADEKPFNHGFLTKDCLGDVCFEFENSVTGGQGDLRKLRLQCSAPLLVKSSFHSLARLYGHSL